jgi:hypothetical protein
MSTSMTIREIYLDFTLVPMAMCPDYLTATDMTDVKQTLYQCGPVWSASNRNEYTGRIGCRHCPSDGISLPITYYIAWLRSLEAARADRSAHEVNLLR